MVNAIETAGYAMDQVSCFLVGQLLRPRGIGAAGSPGQELDNTWADT